jgi:hypothetical protein
MTPMLPQYMDRDVFCTLMKEALKKSTPDHRPTVRFIGHTLMIEVRANPQNILDAVFVPLLAHQPRWEVKRCGWHQVFINEKTAPQYYSTLLTQINTPNERSKRLTKVDRRSRQKAA